MGYTTIRQQPNRLGEFSGELGQTGGGSEYITAIGNAVNGVVNSIFQAKVAIKTSKDARLIAITEATESTKKLGIQTTGMTDQARIVADQTKTKYRTIPVVILASGLSLVAAIGVGAWAYNKIIGDYEIEYE